jgi:hypothetical protein
MTFSASCSTEWSFVSAISSKFTFADDGQQEDASGNILTTTLCNTISLENTVVEMTINGSKITYYAPSSVEVGTETGTDGETEFVAQVDFPSEYCISGTIVYSGGGSVSYDVSPYWLMCANPEPPVGYLNIDIPLNISLDTPSESFSIDGWGFGFNEGTYSCCITVACPIISAEEGE